MDYVTAFDVIAIGYKEWTFPASGLLPVAIGSVLVAWRRSHPIAVRGWWRRAFPYVFLVFGGLWTVSTFVGTYADYRNIRRALETGRFLTVEGPVTKFVPMPFEGHALESFEVSGHRYSYSDYIVTAGFNNTRSHGGPIREGLKVRIADVDGQIARLEILR